MLSTRLATSLLLLILTMDVKTQFFDYFQGLQPLIQNLPTSTKVVTHNFPTTTKVVRHNSTSTKVVTQKRRQYDFIFSPNDGNTHNNDNIRRNSNNNQRFSVESSGNADNSYDVATKKSSVSYFLNDRQTKKTTSNIYTTTTSKPLRRNNSSHFSTSPSKPRSNNNKNVNNNNKPKYQAGLISHEEETNDYVIGENNQKTRKRLDNDPLNNFSKEAYYAIRPIYKISTEVYDFNNYPSINKDEFDLSNNYYDNDNSRPNSNNQKPTNNRRPSYTIYTTSKPYLNDNYNNNKPNNYVYTTSTTKPSYNNQRPDYNSEIPSNNYKPIYNSDTTLRPTFNNQRPDYNSEIPSNYNNNPNYNHDTTSKPTFNNQRPDYNERPSYDTYNTPRPNQNNNQRPTYNNRRPNYDTYTTQSPFYNRPGVKPAVIHGPPITNKPRTQKPFTDQPSYGKNHNFGQAEGSILFPDERDVSAELVTGPDADRFSNAQRLRYLEMAERMCDSYKALDMSQVAAIPLLPSPQPVRVNVSGCRPLTAPLIVGGKVVNIEQFPHNAALGWQKIEGGGYSWKCGGSLISDQFVLTAAHCAYQERDNTVISGPPRVVQLGSSYLNDPGALVVRVTKAIRHPKYKLPRSYYDLAILKLIMRVTFSEVIKPACLGVPPAAGESIIATGWGRTEFGGDSSLELRGVSIPIWDIDTCARVLGTSRRLPDGPSPDSQICAGEVQGGKDTCQGDSGGPAQVQDGCAWRIIGVTSVGRACGAPRTPALYATAQRAFIAAVITDSR